MSDLAETLWKAFATETAEHLVAIEPLLVGLADPASQRSDVPALFRAFHSLKGLARSMSRHGMESVTHEAESLLGLVRDRGASVTEAMVDVLLAATDELRTLREAALASRPDEPASPTLVARLQDAIAAAGGTAKPLPEPAVSQPDEQRDATALGDDREMLELYAEVMQLHLADLARLPSADESERSEIEDALDSLGHGAGVLGMEPLAETLLAIKAALSEQAMPLDPDGRAVTLPLLRDLADKAALLSEMLEQDTGAGALLAALNAAEPFSAPPELPAALGALADALAGGGEAVAPRARAVVALLDQVRAADPARQAMVALLGDICPRLASGSLPHTPGLAAALADIAAVGLADEEQATPLADALRQALAGPDAPGTSKLHGSLVALLDSDQRRELDAALAAGKHVYAVMLFLEDAPVIAGKLLGWLSGVGQMPCNRSVFVRNESWFEMLLVSDLASEALLAGLLQQDPDRACLRELRELLEAGDAPIALDPSAAPRPTNPVAVPMGELRIQAVVIDRFMDAIAEARACLSKLDALLTSTTHGDQLRRLELAGGDTRDVADLLRARQTDAAEQLRRMEGQLRRLHAGALEARIVPIDRALSRLPRVVRGLARELGKDVELVLEGRDVRVDKAIVDRLIEPLLHMVRNAIDHGIEPPEQRLQAGKLQRARLLVRAEQGVGEIGVVVADDGRGLDRERILARGIERGLVSPADAASYSADAIHRLIFSPGFSTAAVLTETSGRGVGMDVVLTEVHRLGGEVAIGSDPGQGTSFSLRLPLTAALQSAVLVRVAGQCLAVPEAAVAHVAEMPRDELALLDGRGVLAFAGRHVPVLSLGEVLWPDDPVSPPTPVARHMVVRWDGETVAFEVEEIVRRQELLLLRLHPDLAKCPCVGGAAVLGDGEVVLLLNVDSLMEAALRTSWRAMSA